MSSRNARLTPAERRAAPKLAATLFAIAERLSAGCAAPAALAKGIAAIRAAGFREVEYLELRADDDLRPLQALDRPARLLVAAWLGGTRLIDNVEVLPRARASAPSE
jgi:pantoate--beta-alanine ligase